MPRDSTIAKSDRQLLEEVVGRSRRTETKVTQIAEQVGLADQVSKPTFDPDSRTVWVKTDKTTIADIIETLHKAEETDWVMVSVAERDLMRVRAA